MSREVKNTATSVQEKLRNFVKILPNHVESWRSILQESVIPVRALLNQAEQLRSIESANVTHYENFEDTQRYLQFFILKGIEDEIARIQSQIEKLSKLNHDLRNKLTVLEKSSLDLDWEQQSDLLTGSATQPSLSVILQGGLGFYVFFSSALKKISDAFLQIDVRNEQSLSLFKDTFSVDLEEKTVRYFLALTQYINNEKSLI